MKKKLLSILLAICMLCTLLPMSVLAATPAENEIKLELVKDSTTFPGKDVLRVDFYAKSGTDVPDNHMVYLKYDAKKLAPLSAETADDVSEYCTNFSENNSSALTANPYTIKVGMGKKTSEVMLYTIIKEGKGYICWKVTEPTGTPAFADFTRISSIFFGLKGGVNFDKLPKDIIKLATVAEDYTVTAQSNSISITVNGGEALRYGNKTASNNNLTVDLGKLFVAGDGVKFASSTPATLTGISVKTAPTTVIYTEGENFDKTGMVIEATYSDSTKKDVTGYTYAPTAALTTSDTTITISYTEDGVTETCTQAITVNAAPATKTLSSISVKTAPTKVIYTEGENFDKTGMVIEATYSDSTKKDVTTYTYTPTAALTTSDTTITISYTEGSETKTCTQTITVNAVTPPAPTEYTITFNVNGGSGTIPPQTTSGQKLSSLPTATRSGSYSFDGWYTSGGTQITTAYVFSANTTVYAHWTYTGGSSSGVVSASTYPITVDKSVNGSVSVSNGSAVKDASVTITVKPDKGYTLETLRALDMSGYAMELTENNGRFTFKMPASAVIVKATFMDDNTMLNLFVDVKASDYFYDAVLWAAEKGVTSGTDALHFSPNAPCTRAQIVTFLWRAAGSPAPKNMSSFADVPADAFYAKAVAWAVENGITGGTGDGKFSPDAPCTRAQAVTFLYRASGAPAVSGNAAFSDVATNAYYAAAVKWAEKNGITGGIGGGLFGSNNNCTRAQIVAFLYRSVK